jgi:NitT/TauT family transport system substrate-binding protein
MLAAFLRATARGWASARSEPDKAADLLIKEYPNLKRDDELEGIKSLLGFAFNANTKANGWGAFDTAVWQSQIALYDELKQFTAGVPKLDDVITTSVLDATKDARPKVG